MQGYDRELDSEDDETGEGLAFEEQLIFRMPEGPECDKLRESIQKRQLGDDVWFKFKDSRRAVVHVGESLFSAKLVDLPTITESHKTLDNRQFFKVADIAQMLVVEGKIADESQASSSGAGKGFNIEDFVYPHGITPPMQWARKRRFRKRAARRAIETVEKEVERLLKADKKAEEVEYEMIDAADEGGSDEDDARGQSRRGVSFSGGSQAETPMPDGSDAGSQDEEGTTETMMKMVKEHGAGLTVKMEARAATMMRISMTRMTWTKIWRPSWMLRWKRRTTMTMTASRRAGQGARLRVVRATRKICGMMMTTTMPTTAGRG